MNGPESYAVRAHVQAWQITADNLGEVAQWCSGEVFDGGIEFTNAREEPDFAEVDDWIVCGTTGGFFTLDNRWFHIHYYRQDVPTAVTYGCLTGVPLRVVDRR